MKGSKMYIAFLRGINVSGTNKIDMKELTLEFEKHEYKSVKTYLNTGNVIFTSQLKGVKNLESDIQEMILNDFGLDIEVIVKTQNNLYEMVEEYPFESPDGKNKYIVLMKSQPDPDLTEALDEVKVEGDQYEITDKVVYLYVPNGFGKSKISNNFVEKKGHVVATTRNINTLSKLLNKMD